MFGWLVKIFRRERRGLFQYHDGHAWQHGDPWRLHRMLFNDPKIDAIAGELSAINSEEPGTSEFLNFVSGVFKLQRWDGRRGLTDSEVYAVFTSYCEYVEAVKKNISLGQTLPHPTESLSPNGTDQAEHGSGSADSPLMANGQAVGEQVGT